MVREGEREAKREREYVRGNMCNTQYPCGEKKVSKGIGNT